jgi:predicted nucleic acid-binding protein
VILVRTHADTSFLFSLYASDAHSARADAWRLANPAPLPFTDFHRLELRNALSLALFQQRLTRQEIQTAWQEVENDCATGLLVARSTWWHHVLTEAETYTQNHTPNCGCRTLDVLHVAVAKLMGTAEFCTFDTRQSNLASQVGLLPVLP